jgi:hypothetical protein
MDGMAPSDATPPEPRVLTLDEATAICLALRNRTEPVKALPACPDCAVPPDEVVRSPSFDRVSVTLRFAFQPCGHMFTIDNEVMWTVESALIPGPRREQAPTPAAAQVALFVEQAAELRRLRADLERSRRRECNEACDAVGDERERLAQELQDAHVGLVDLGERVTDWAGLSRRHQNTAVRYYRAWTSARSGRRTRSDEREAWRALYEAGEDAVQLRTLTARVEELSGALKDVLGAFVHETHPGRRCLQSEHVGVDTVQKWRDTLNTRPVPERCVGCGSPQVVYHNYKEQSFCRPCCEGPPGPAHDRNGQ